MTLKQYEQLIEDRPRKFDTDDVDYRPAEGDERCKGCQHFFVRLLDKFGVCEIFRDDDTDEDGVNPNYVCNFFTTDGEDFPLLEAANGDDSDS